MATDENIKSTILNLLSNDTEIQQAVHDYVWTSVLKSFRQNINAYFLLSMTIQIQVMHYGFALLEAGCIRAKNATNSMWRNCICGFVAAFGFWITGFKTAFGKSIAGFAPSVSFNKSTTDFNDSGMWLIQFSFCATAATIISGAIAERSHIRVFLLSSFIMSSITYPFIVHWGWHEEGWLKKGVIFNYSESSLGTNRRVGFVDFAGSGIVHLTGGAASLAGIIILGPRRNRFIQGKLQPIYGHSTTLAALGCMILSVGFIAFNAGSQLHLDVEGASVSMTYAAVNTILAGTGGLISVGLFAFWKTKQYPLLPPLFGSLTGNVAACAGCDVLDGWAAFAVGLVAGLFYILTSWLVSKLELDDAIDAVGVHLGGGVIGIISVALLSPKNGVFYNWDVRSFLFLAWQILGGIVIFAWSFSHTMLIFVPLKRFKMVQMADAEDVGMDLIHGHEVAYPFEDLLTNATNECPVVTIGSKSHDHIKSENSERVIRIENEDSHQVIRLSIPEELEEAGKGVVKKGHSAFRHPLFLVTTQSDGAINMAGYEPKSLSLHVV